MTVILRDTFATVWAALSARGHGAPHGPRTRHTATALRPSGAALALGVGMRSLHRSRAVSRWLYSHAEHLAEAFSPVRSAARSHLLGARCHGRDRLLRPPLALAAEIVDHLT